MNANARIAGTLVMAPTDEGGLEGPLQTPTPSLLLAFDNQEEMAEAMIFTSTGEPLEPGGEYRFEMEFWTDASRAEARPGRAFRLWHGGIVGSGRFD